RNPPFLASGKYRRFLADVDSSCRIAWDEASHDDQYWAARMRLLAHAVDKGLHSDPVERGRGKHIYEKTVESLASVRSAESREEPTVKWGEERGGLYGELQDIGVGIEGAAPTEYYRDLGPEFEAFATLTRIIRGRRSSRLSEERPVSDELL